MNKFKSMFVLLALAFAFVACEKDPIVEPEPPKVEVTQTEYSIAATDVSLLVEYTTNTEFTIQTPEWIHTSSVFSSPIQFTIDAYDELVSRVGEIQFLHGGLPLNKITVRQYGAQASMNFGDSSYDVGEEASKLELTVTANFPFSVESDAWITAEVSAPTKATETRLVTISYEANKLTESRKGMVKFVRSDTSEDFATITLNQAAHVLQLLGFYQANEGTWGANNASLDYYNFSTSTITNHWWLSINPDVRGGLGDVANDVCVYNDYLLIVVNTSNILEICDRDGNHLGEVEVPNCRKVVAYGDYAYVTSYSGSSVSGTSEGDGYVSKISLSELKEVAQCPVDDQPENLFIYNDNIYVVNTFGYQYPCTTNSSCSVISLETFKETSRNNLGYLNAYGAWKNLGNGTAFVSFSGDFGSNPAKCAIVDLSTWNHIKDFDFSGTYADVVGDELYIMGTVFSWITFDWEYNNYKYSISTGELFNFPFNEDIFSTYGAPTGIWVNPVNSDIYIADQGNYTSPAYLYHYNSAGSLIEKLNVGVCPGHLAWDWR